MKLKRLFLAVSLVFLLGSCDTLLQIANEAQNVTLGEPTESEIADAIREALIVGSKNTVSQTSSTNGFYNNSLIKIPFPPEAKKVEETARSLGLGNQVDNFVKTLNRGAEEAAKKATPIFVDAIKGMSLRDVYGIWKGNDDAATQYLRSTTEAQLRTQFSPVIKDALTKVELTKYWNPVISAYNKIPFVENINPDLDQYVLDQTLNGLFKVIAQEEEKIREDPAARVTAILQRVFGYQG